MKARQQQLDLSSHFKKDYLSSIYSSNKLSEEGKLPIPGRTKLSNDISHDSCESGENIWDDEVEDEPKKPGGDQEVTKSAAGSNFLRDPKEMVPAKDFRNDEIDQDDIKEDRPLQTENNRSRHQVFNGTRGIMKTAGLESRILEESKRMRSQTASTTDKEALAFRSVKGSTQAFNLDKKFLDSDKQRLKSSMANLNSEKKKIAPKE